jgi:hypothetical protein
MKSALYLVSALGMVALTAMPLAAQPGEPAHATSSAGITINARFDNLAVTPEIGNDVVFDVLADPSAPTVRLVRGANTQGTMYEWRVWCVDAQENPADIGIIESPGSYNYSVTILHADGGPGAADVGTIDLTPAGDHRSSIVAGEITGSLSAGLALVQDSNDGGGEVSLIIGQDVTGDITVPLRATCESLGIWPAIST